MLMQTQAKMSRIQPIRMTERPESRMEEFDDIVALLWEHALAQTTATRELVQFIANACMGDNHLWQDMGLPSRAALSTLMRENFPQLVEKNSGDMKWKKFFYKQLCERADILICKSPSCGVCVDYDQCFGPET